VPGNDDAIRSCALITGAIGDVVRQGHDVFRVEEERARREAEEAGAVGYLLKDGEPHEVVAGIRAAARGESPLDPKAARALIDSNATRIGDPDLTDREREVLQLLANGLANKQIGRKLSITERTVKAHLTRIYAAIGVSDRTSAAVWAHQHGLD
jgi:DNA-binding NarL/FixJ family response regulator